MGTRTQAAQRQADANAGKEDSEPELIAVGAGADLSDAGESEQEESSDADDGEHEDSRLDADEEGVTDQGRRPRETSKQRRIRHQRQRDRNRLELSFLRTRNEDLERRLSSVEVQTVGTQVASIDQRIDSLKSSLQLADQVIAEAIDADPETNPNRGKDVVEAQRIRDGLRDQLGQANHLKRQIAARGQEGQDGSGRGGGQDTRRAPAQGQQRDPEAERMANEWSDANEWYDPRGGDEDSAIAQAIDRTLAKTMRPSDPRYWKELTKRVQKRLPHLFTGTGPGDEEDDEDGEDDDAAEQRDPGAFSESRNRGAKGKAKGGRAQGNGGPRFTVRGRERPLRSNEVHINQDRKQALIDAGVWDDPLLRQRYLKNYQEYDRQHGRSR